jgi:hypothetical protein
VLVDALRFSAIFDPAEVEDVVSTVIVVAQNILNVQLVCVAGTEMKSPS